MPAPAAVYIIVTVVGAAAAAYALKEFVYEPHLKEKFEDWKNQARAFYLRKRAARGPTRAQPFHFASDNDNGDGDASEIGADVELEGLLKSRGIFAKSNYDSGEMRLRENASGATVTAVATGVSPSMSRTSGNDGVILVHQDQQVRQRNVAPLLDLEETSPHDPIEPYTPSEPTATTTTPINPFRDQNLVLLNDEPALKPMPQSPPGQKINRDLLSSSNSNTFSFSPLSQTYTLGVDSPVVLSPLTSPRSQAGILTPEIPPSVPDSSSSNNPWESVPRAALSPSVPDVGSLISSWDSEHGSNLDMDVSLSTLSRDLPNESGLREPVTSLEMMWTRDDADSEASFTTNSSTLTSSTSTSSIASRAEEGPRNGELDPPLGRPRLETIEQSVSGLSDAEWERLSDVDHRSPSP